MAIEKRFKKLTKKTKNLLAGGENELVDYKRQVKGVKADHLVAFANTDTGGDILVGVDEGENKDGSQRGIVVGCDIGDSSMLEILNKANSCHPPVAVKIFAENTDSLAMLRINIPPSRKQPHSTPGGVFYRRNGSHIRPLQPNELLDVFLKNEAQAFTERFEKTAKVITDDLAALEFTIEDKIESIGGTLEWAEMNLSTTDSTIGTILAKVNNLTKEVGGLSLRVKALFDQDGRKDPVRERIKDFIFAEIIKEIERAPYLIERVEPEGADFSIPGKYEAEINREDRKEIIFKVRKAVENKYFVVVEEPENLPDRMKADFVKLVERGGEVSEGLMGRVEKAVALGFLYSGKRLVGTAAIKRPSKSYRKKVFEKAATDKQRTEYSFELGWIYVSEDQRGAGHTMSLIDATLEAAGDEAIFATTRTNNDAMKHILKKKKFFRTGKSYASEQNPDENLYLFLRR